MSILTTEYNAEAHRRVFARDYAQEKVEERDMEYARQCLHKSSLQP